jgi:WhiB family redox-sensing transcriptional regulator
VSGWEQYARCRTVGRDAFFPTSRGAEATADMKPAQAVCNWCPVAAQCLAYALENERGLPAHWRAGVFGGATPRQRAAIDRKQQQRQQQQAA